MLRLNQRTCTKWSIRGLDSESEEEEPKPDEARSSEGGMRRLESLIELKILNSSFLSLSSYRN